MNAFRRLPLSLPLLLAGCTTGHHAGEAPSRPQVIAHRGASAYAPENTLAAFEKAVELGAGYFELDCRITRDDAIVVLHDGDLERTAGIARPITAMTLDELREVEVGAWFGPAFAGEPLPTLAESLALAKERIGVYVEIKSCDDDGALHSRLAQAAQDHSRLSPRRRRELMQRVEESGTRNLELTRQSIAIIREAEMIGQVVIQSFSPVVCLVTRCEAPEIRCEFLGSDDPDRPDLWRDFLAFGYLIGVDGFNVHQDSLNEDRLAAFRRGKTSVAVWTVDDEAAMRRFARWEVDGIITNKPDVAIGILAEKGGP